MLTVVDAAVIQRISSCWLASQSEVGVVDVHDHDVNEDDVVKALFSTELTVLQPMMLTMLRTSDVFKLVIDSCDVDVDL